MRVRTDVRIERLAAPSGGSRHNWGVAMRRLFGVALASALTFTACGDDVDDAISTTDPTGVSDATSAETTVVETGPSSSAAASTLPEASTSSVEVCASSASFAGEADGSFYGPSFDRDGFHFEALNGVDDLFANLAGSTVALQFGDDGLRIALPATASTVIVNAGTYASQVTVEALDASGNSQGVQVLPDRAPIQPLSFNGSIALLTLVGGNNEGVVFDICAEAA